MEYMKATVRAKLEHPFQIIKCQFGFTKARYRGLMKNDCKLATLSLLWPIASEWVKCCEHRTSHPEYREIDVILNKQIL